MRRAGLNPFDRLDRVTREPVRRDEYDPPLELLRLDVKRLGRVLLAGGKRFAQGLAETLRR